MIRNRDDFFRPEIFFAFSFRGFSKQTVSFRPRWAGFGKLYGFVNNHHFSILVAALIRFGHFYLIGLHEASLHETLITTFNW